jgi:hypothetical protein
MTRNSRPAILKPASAGAFRRQWQGKNAIFARGAVNFIAVRSRPCGALHQKMVSKSSMNAG